MNKRIKPLFKGIKTTIETWILEHLPHDHQNLDYLELFSESCIFANKPKVNPPKIEVINEKNFGFMQVLRSLKNDHKTFSSKIKKMTCSERVFQREKNQTEFDNCLSHSLNEYYLKKLSKNGDKLVYDQNHQEEFLKNLDNFPLMAERLKDCFLINKEPLDLIFAFDTQDSFCVFSPPANLTLEEHTTYSEKLLNYRGKLMIYTKPLTFYNKLYRELKSIKLRDNNHNIIATMWINY